MKKTESSSKKSKNGTTGWAFPSSQKDNVRTTPYYAKFVSDDGVEQNDVLMIRGNWGDKLYKDHPETRPFRDFIDDLYKEGHEDTIRQGRKELSSFLVGEAKKVDLKALRLSKGFSQEELAEKAGVRQYQISRYESGQEYPSVPTLMKLCSALEEDPNMLCKALGYGG